MTLVQIHEQRRHAVLIAVFIALGIAAFVLLIRLRKAVLKKRQDQEQIDRKMKEDALDRALSNNSSQRARLQVQIPVEVHYNSGSSGKGGAILRLTEQSESVTKEYLFQQTDIIYIGEEYGRAAIFRDQGKGRLYCEFFPFQGSVYVRLCGREECRLIRGKQIAPLTAKAIRLRSGDRIETQLGIFLIELI